MKKETHPAVHDPHAGSSLGGDHTTFDRLPMLRTDVSVPL